MGYTTPFHSVTMIAGLGNPDKEYLTTYHNVGLQALLFLAGETAAWRTRKSFRYAKVGSRIFVAPLTYMNESGRAIRDALRFFTLRPNALLVLQDDSDLTLGAWKAAFGRGTAGHHGIASIVRELGTNEFARIRIGIRKPDSKKKAGSFVLKKIPPSEKKLFKNVFEEIASSLT